MLISVLVLNSLGMENGAEPFGLCRSSGWKPTPGPTGAMLDISKKGMAYLEMNGRNKLVGSFNLILASIVIE